MPDPTKPGPSAGIRLTPPSTTYPPGPWHFECHSLCPVWPDPERSAVRTILEAESMGCGFADSDPAATSAELAADHRLIVAAPMLFEELHRVRDVLQLALRIVDSAVAAAGKVVAQ